MKFIERPPRSNAHGGSAEEINMRSPRMRPSDMAGRDNVPIADGVQMPSAAGGYDYSRPPYKGVKDADPGGGGSDTIIQKQYSGVAPPQAQQVLRRRGQLDPRFEVRRNPSCPHRGRGIFATQDVKEGTKVMVARQAAAVPNDKYRAAFCRRCLVLLEKSALIKCRRCEDRFCGKVCVIAAAGEGTHEATCGFMENLDGCDDPGSAECEERGGGYGDGGEGEETDHRHHLKESLFAQSEDAYAPAATEAELLRLTMECLARRRAGLTDELEWEEVADLDCGQISGSTSAAISGDEKSLPSGDRGSTNGSSAARATLDPTVLREAQARLKGGRVQVSAEEIQMVYERLRRNFYPLQPEPLGRLLPPTVISVFPAAALVNHSCEPNACFHARRAGPGGPPLEYVLRCMNDVKAGEEVCVSYLAHFATAAKEGRPELLERVWGISCDCPSCEVDVPAGSSAGDWRVTKMLEDMEAILESAETRSAQETQAEIRCYLEQGLQVLLAGPDISPRLKLQLAIRIDEISIRRRMHGSLRFRSAQELAERLVRSGLDNGYTADLRFTMHREALRWAQDARLEGSYRRGEQMTRASRDSLEEAIKVAVVCLGEAHPKTLALIECLRRFSHVQI